MMDDGGTKARREMHLPTYLLAVMFGSASWLGVNGLWVELPVLVSRLPEGWSMPSYLTVIVSLGNILPLAYVAHTRQWGAAQPSRRRLTVEVPLVIAVLSMQLLACILLVFCWSFTVDGHSVSLMVLVCLISMADCSSSVILMPFMSHYPAVYLTAYYTGASLSGLLPALIALAQGSQGEPRCVTTTSVDPLTGATSLLTHATTPQPRFGPSYFFLSLALLTLCSLIAFLALNVFYPPEAQRTEGDLADTEDVVMEDVMMIDAVADVPTVVTAVHNGDCTGHIAGSRIHRAGFRGWVWWKGSVCDEEGCRWSSCRRRLLEGGPCDAEDARDRPRLATALSIIFMINAVANGVLPSVQSYTCLPFGYAAYHLAVALSSTFNTLASMSVTYAPPSKVVRSWLGPLTCVLLGVGAYLLAMAVLSPHPPLAGSTAGSTIVVIAWIMLNSLFTFVKVSIARDLGETGGARHLVLIGIVTQVASTVGSLVMFPMVAVYHVFRAASPLQC